MWKCKEIVKHDLLALQVKQTPHESSKSDWFPFSTFTSGVCAIVSSPVFSWPTEITLHMKPERTKMLSGTFKMVFNRVFIVTLKVQTQRDSDERLHNTSDWSMLVHSSQNDFSQNQRWRMFNDRVLRRLASVTSASKVKKMIRDYKISA